MSDSNDPFADNPYQRPDQASPGQQPDPPGPPDPVPPPPPEPEPEPAESSASNGDDGHDSHDADTEPTQEFGTGDTGTDENIYRYADSAAAEQTTVIPPHGPGTEPAPPTGGGRSGGIGALIVVLALILGLFGGVGGAAGYQAITGGDDNDSGDTGTVSSLEDDSKTEELPPGAFEKVSEIIMPSVVQINVAGQSGSGSGSGIIISSDGEILTNNHVVEAADKGSGTLNVAFSDGKISKAEVKGTDPVTDLAVIKVEEHDDLTPAKLGDSGDLKVGQQVVAIGSPFGLESTVTTGIVSALNRPVSSGDEAGSTPTIFPAVQTDAAINPGNSGGPLVDLDGRVIAINSAIRSSTSQSGESGSIGLGFAIPVDLAKHVSKHLSKGEKVPHAQIGVTVGSDVKKDQITTTGAEVKKVTSGSAGDDAGLKVGDVITAVEGNAIASSDALVATVRGFEPGDTIKVTFNRGEDQKTVDVKLGSDTDGDAPDESPGGTPDED